MSRRRYLPEEEKRCRPKSSHNKGKSWTFPITAGNFIPSAQTDAVTGVGCSRRTLKATAWTFSFPAVAPVQCPYPEGRTQAAVAVVQWGSCSCSVRLPHSSSSGQPQQRVSLFKGHGSQACQAHSHSAVCFSPEFIAHCLGAWQQDLPQHPKLTLLTSPASTPTLYRLLQPPFLTSRLTPKWFTSLYAYSYLKKQAGR